MGCGQGLGDPAEHGKMIVKLLLRWAAPRVAIGVAGIAGAIWLAGCATTRWCPDDITGQPRQCPVQMKEKTNA